MMKKKNALRTVLLLLLAVLIVSGTAGCAGADPGAFRTEDCPMERAGQRIYGKLYLPETAESPLPLIILSHGLGSNHRIMEPYAERFAQNGFAACVFCP